MITFILGIAAFYYGVHLACALIFYLLTLVSNGFNFRQASEERQFIYQQIRERKAQKELEGQRSQEEYLAKRRERLGY